MMMMGKIIDIVRIISETLLSKSKDSRETFSFMFR